MSRPRPPLVAPWSRIASATLAVAALASAPGCGAPATPAADAGSDAPARPDAAGVDAPRGHDAAPGSDGASSEDVRPHDGDAPVTSRTYRGTDAVIPNPERGFYRYVEITSETDFRPHHAAGYRLVFSYVRLDAVRDRPITPAILDAMVRGLNAARAAGVKVVLRFAYNDGPYPDSQPDASKAWVLRHIEQLRPYLRDHGDVIAVVQAGFIGAWGEWHTSTNRLLDDPRDRREILEALVSALPPDRMTQIRYPAYKFEMYGGPLDPARAFEGSVAARVGHHNDCFLSSETDVGTYPEGEVERWRTYLAADALYVPMGGETCAVHPPRSECASALGEMARLRYSFINQDYHPEVVRSWSTGGCRTEMDRRLGYRLALLEADLPAEARPGQGFTPRLRVRNDGWAAMYNPRPVYLVLDGAATAPGRRVELPLAGVDPRRWGPGQGATVQQRVTLPADLPAGEYRLSLWLPDASDRLRARPEYAVRLANDGVTWEPSTGLNVLATVRVAP